MTGKFYLFALIFCASFVAAGCDPTADNSATESSNIKPLAVFYGRFVGANRGRVPKSEQELKDFIAGRPAEELQIFGISDVENLFVSSRDNQPYKFNFNAKAIAPGQMVVFVWEQTGVDGSRYVGGTLGEVEEVDEQRFRELVSE